MPLVAWNPLKVTAFAALCSMFLSACGGGNQGPATVSQGTSVLPESDSLAPIAQAAAPCTWHIVPAQNAGTDFGDWQSLNGIVPRSQSDVWAAGYFNDYSKSLSYTLTEHYDGAKWTIVPSPNYGTQRQNQLWALASAGANDLWAVGYDQPPGFGAPYWSLIEHWNGKAWSIVEDNTHQGWLFAVAAPAPNDVWMGGTTNFPGSTVMEHWNGTKISYTVLPFYGQFRGMTALSSDDIWAVGDITVVLPDTDKTLAYHYDGSKWTQVFTPTPLHGKPGDENWLTGVSAISRNDVWAFGEYRNPDFGILDTPFMEHWDGHSWTLVNAPTPGGSHEFNSIWGGVAVKHNDVWAVGQVGSATFQTMTQHWDGKAFSVEPSPRQQYANLLAAGKDPSGRVWTVGDTVVKPYVTGVLTELCE